ncbi:DNA polymerase/3'-5' exonuclease PolX [Ferruginivarius sediminum]|uniref:DNA polymerase beta n=1 Tax=Ferruginivarius sediminum TaxID=2661937 RepID=A0A369TD11_9PROT|nr:DNA polymerase/3'-5' exonuclease PolX [Ferruginivarius sediminum]RDD63199.1 DNA polymerase/3'-5' exonuclease PolX [Ferruginivarius sediminum]
MPIHNSDIAEQFDEVADLLEIEGANAFRIRAYRNAARTLRDLAHSVAGMVRDDADLTELPGIGKDLAGKIETIVETGKFPQLEDLKKDVPEGLVDVLGIAGLGPKRVQKIHEELGVTDLEGLTKAAKEGRVRKLSGFGKKTEDNILHELETRGSGETRTQRREAEGRAEPLVDYLAGTKGVDKVVVAGSYRRRKETVGDLDILVTCTSDSPVVKRFVDYEDVRDVISKGETRSTVILKNGLQVDLRVVESASYGAALHYFTGSKAHNIHVRRMGQDQGLKINEYGVFRGDKRIAGKTEEEVYAQVGLPYIEPELREDRGEIEAARTGKLPELIELDDIRGNLHSHTKASDGANTLREMAAAAKERGWAYIAITDHSKAVRVANGLDEDRLAKQIDEIDAVNDELEGITLLKSIEVDILEDGGLDLPDSILKRLDLRICAVHSHFRLSRDKQTERVMQAMDNPCFTIMAHPTGRLIGTREAYAIDMERIIEHARQTGCILELNAQPERLDLNDAHCKMARDAGVKLSIGTDAHTTGQLDFMRYGIDQARRGWVTADDVVNTRSLKDLRKLVAR